MRVAKNCQQQLSQPEWHEIFRFGEPYLSFTGWCLVTSKWARYVTCFHTRRREKEQLGGSRAEASSTVAGIPTFKHFFPPSGKWSNWRNIFIQMDWNHQVQKCSRHEGERSESVCFDWDKWSKQMIHSLHNCCFKVVFLPPILMKNMFLEGGFQPSLTDNFFKQRSQGYWTCCLKRALLQYGKAKIRLKFSYIIPSRGDFSRFFPGITSIELINQTYAGEGLSDSTLKNINFTTKHHPPMGNFEAWKTLKRQWNGLILWL